MDSIRFVYTSTNAERVANIQPLNQFAKRRTIRYSLALRVFKYSVCLLLYLGLREVLTATPTEFELFKLQLIILTKLQHVSM